jgi:nucleoside transport protein
VVIAQLIIGYILLKSNVGIKITLYISSIFNKLISYADNGINFLLGNIITKTSHFVFLINALLPIIFISALIGILHYFRILPLLARFFGTILNLITGAGKLESFNAISSMCVGQSENLIIYKDIFHKLSESTVYTITATSMSMVSLSILFAYTKIINPQYVCIAIPLNILGVFFILGIINPATSKDNISKEILNLGFDRSLTFFDVIGSYMLIGLKIVLNISAIVIGFIALISMLNDISTYLVGISFQNLISYIFMPFILLWHITSSDSLIVSKIISTKIFSNEIVAMLYMKQHLSHMSHRAVAMTSVFLISFANIGSIGIIFGTLKSMSDKSSILFAKYSIRILFSATLASYLSASIVGVFV